MPSLLPEERAAERKQRQRGRYHTAPTDIRPSSDIRVSRWPYSDQYIGTADALAESGLLNRELFPGEPGQPLSAVTYRPLNSTRTKDEWLHLVPGYMQVFRLPTGLFRISLTVSREEQARREQEAKRKTNEQRAQQDAARQAEAREVAAGILARNDGLAGRVRALEEEGRVIAEYNTAVERSPAVLRVGDRAVYHSGKGTTKVTVLVGYGVHNVRDEGPRFGYCVEGTAGEFAGDTFFAFAGSLCAMDSRPSHLRLVRPAAVVAS